MSVTDRIHSGKPDQNPKASPSRSVTSKEIEANWLEFLRAGQLSELHQRDAYSHTCEECGERVEVTGSSIRIARSANTKLNLPCGHTASVPVP